MAEVLHGQWFGRDAHGVLPANHGDAGLHPTLEQVVAWRQEIADARRNLEREEAELHTSLEPQAYKMAREVRCQIETDETSYPLFERASQWQV